MAISAPVETPHSSSGTCGAAQDRAMVAIWLVVATVLACAGIVGWSVFHAS